LSQLVFPVRVFHQIGLVDYVDQVLRLGDSPENPVDAKTQLPVLAHMKPVKLAQIEMGAFRIQGVEPPEGDEGDAVVAAVPFVPEFGMQDKGRVEGRTALSMMGRRAWEDANVPGNETRELCFACQRRIHEAEGKKQDDRGERRPHLTLLRLFLLKSPSLRPVRNE
jgi:hypothetical protein